MKSSREVHPIARLFRARGVLMLALIIVPPIAHGEPSPPDAGTPRKYRAVQPQALDGQLVYSPNPHLPDAAKARDGGLVHGQYMIYVDLDGSVPRVDVVQSIPNGDAAIIATLLTWKAKPQRERIRFIRHWAFSVR